MDIDIVIKCVLLALMFIFLIAGLVCSYKVIYYANKAIKDKELESVYNECNLEREFYDLEGMI